MAWRVQYLTRDREVCHVKIVSTRNRMEAAREVVSGLVAAERLWGATAYVVTDESGAVIDPFGAP